MYLESKERHWCGLFIRRKKKQIACQSGIAVSHIVRSDRSEIRCSGMFRWVLLSVSICAANTICWGLSTVVSFISFPDIFSIHNYLYFFLTSCFYCIAKSLCKLVFTWNNEFRCFQCHQSMKRFPATTTIDGLPTSLLNSYILKHLPIKNV